MKGVDMEYHSYFNEPDMELPVKDVYYADDAIFLSTEHEDMQRRFSVLEKLTKQVG